ncbi:MAG: hypothetical protein D3926_04555 [Desulfobacteraceae bacterium]|nr:MAG: hypothetical protein D3926_04555 [Desulfobacteraceae bacterium]
MKTINTFFIVCFILAIAMNTFAFESKRQTATGDAYLDIATGHKYTKNPDGTYMEFTKRGEVYRVSVSPHLHLLTTNKYIREVEPNPVAKAASYLDVFTGHRYFKNTDGTYREYTRRGELFRVSVSPDKHLLTTNRHIREIGQDSYVIYKRNKNRKTEILILPSGQKHPRGWFVDNLLASVAH